MSRAKDPPRNVRYLEQKWGNHGESVQDCPCFAHFFLSSCSHSFFAEADLARVLTVENIAPLLAKAEILEALFPFIPAKASRTKEELTDIINSPPFRQAVATLNEGLQTGQLSGFVAQLGLDPSVGGPLGGVQAFIEAIRLQAESSKKGSNEMQE